VKTPTDHMIDVAFWRAVPVEWRSIVRSYVDSNNATDQARAATSAKPTAWTTPQRERR